MNVNGRAATIAAAAPNTPNKKSVIPTLPTKLGAGWGSLKRDSYAGMLEIILGLREHSGNCYGFENYAQMPLAHVFLTAKTGEVGSARRLLNDYIL
jgi:hypothetical protein